MLLAPLTGPPFDSLAWKLLYAARGAPVLLVCLPFGAQQLGAEIGYRRTPAQVMKSVELPRPSHAFSRLLSRLLTRSLAFSVPPHRRAG